MWREGQYFSCVGIGALDVFFIIVVWLYFRKKEKGAGIAAVEPRCMGVYSVSPPRQGEDFAFLMSTKDCMLAKIVIDALKQNKIDGVVLDKHSSRIMQFLPDVDMRIMVPTKDYEESVKIVEDLKGLE
jgi:hypothetical protein